MKLRLLVLVLAVPVLPIVLGSPAHAEDAATVTFPEVTRFNPLTTPYDVVVSDPTPELGALQVTVRQRHLAVPSGGGTVRAQFGSSAEGNDRVVTVERCVTATDCSVIATSSALDVWSTLRLRPAAPIDQTPGEHTAYLAADGQPEGESWSGEWTFEDRTNGVVLGSGDSVVTEQEDGRLAFDYSLPALEQDTSYALTLRIGAQTEDFGPLDGVIVYGWRVDDDADRDVVLQDIPTLYPERDDYRDQMSTRLEFRQDGLRKVAVEVIDPQGVVRFTKAAQHTRYERTFEVRWGGLVGGKPAEPGRYVLRVQGEDKAGNLADVRMPFKVASGKLTRVHVVKKLTPQGTLQDSFVGRCSLLRKLPRGGLGLYSQTSCTREKQSPVVSVHGVYIESAPVNPAYDNFRVTVTGGAKPGQKDAYVVLGYRDKDNEFSFKAVLDAKRGAHPGRLAGRKFVLQYDDDRPFFLWQLGLTAGSKWEATRFTLEYDATLLR